MLGDEIPKDTVIEFVCNPGYYLTKGYRAACKEGNWLGNTQAVCEREYLNILVYSVGNKAVLWLLENNSTNCRQKSFIFVMVTKKTE